MLVLHTLLLLIADRCHVPDTYRLYLHNSRVVTRNRIFSHLRCSHAENLEVYARQMAITMTNMYYMSCSSSLTCLNCRISVIFRVRSAKAVKITDMNLLKRLGIIIATFTVFLVIRTLVAPPLVIVGRTTDDLKAYLCRTDWWDHSFSIRKYINSLGNRFSTLTNTIFYLT